MARPTLSAIQSVVEDTSRCVAPIRSGRSASSRKTSIEEGPLERPFFDRPDAHASGRGVRDNIGCRLLNLGGSTIRAGRGGNAWQFVYVVAGSATDDSVFNHRPQVAYQKTISRIDVSALRESVVSSGVNAFFSHDSELTGLE